MNFYYNQAMLAHLVKVSPNTVSRAAQSLGIGHLEDAKDLQESMILFLLLRLLIFCLLRIIDRFSKKLRFFITLKVERVRQAFAIKWPHI